MRVPGLRALMLASWAMMLALPALSVPARAAELVMVESAGCLYCAQWHAALGPIYPRTEEGRIAPLRRIDHKDAALGELDLASPTRFTPTFILMDEGQEIGRIEGYPGEDFFWGLLGRLIERLPKETGPGA